MPVNYVTPAPEQLHPVAGVRLGVAEAGIRKANRRDLTLIELAPGSRVAGVFTRNRFCAAPVHVCRQHLKQEGIRALVINTGIANAGTGEPGMETARQSCAAVAKLMDIAAECGLVPADLAETVRDAYREYRRLQHLRRLNNLDSRVDAAPHAARIAAVRALWNHVFGEH